MLFEFFFFFILFSIPFIFIELPDENGKNSCVFTRIWKIYDNKLNILTTIGMLIIQFIYNINIFFIIDKFSPAHTAIAYIFEYFAIFLINTATEDIKIENKNCEIF